MRSYDWLLLAALALTLLDLSGFSTGLSLGHVNTLFFAACLGKGVRAWTFSQDIERCRFDHATYIIFSLVCILTFLSLLPNVSFDTLYRGELRWNGIWGNPNTYGTFAGLGLLLAAGLLWVWIRIAPENRKAMSCGTLEDWKRRSHIGRPEGPSHPGFRFPRSFRLKGSVVCCLASLWMVIALLHSYSRGAWVATIVGGVYIGVGAGTLRLARLPAWMRSNVRQLALLLLSAAVLAGYQLADTNWSLAGRLFSILNINDFSWTNRIAAWFGAVEIVADFPIFGVGLDRVELIYKEFYSIHRLAETGAIQRNDFLLMAAGCGLPATFSLLTYFAGCLLCTKDTRTEQPKVPKRIGQPQSALDLERFQLLCRGGAIFLILTFALDGGLFELGTSAVFFMLLELGRRDMILSSYYSHLSSALPRICPSPIRTTCKPV
ncbi:MAG: O-antigen ligase family protein [Verrucomicrobiales bacterium]|nr:O-antigen ligase family protein [Verrucomicrobiales bacterium]